MLQGEGTSEQKVYQGRLRGKFKQSKIKIKSTNPLAVGDYVDFEVESEEENTAIIVDIHERRNYLVRQSTRKRWHKHVIAANIDLAIVMATVKQPRTSPGFIDRFLVSAESFEIPALVLFNKHDLLDEDEKEYQEQYEKLYRSLGYQSMHISALNKDGMDELYEVLKGKKSLIAGHSGVGKSTLINTLVPEAQQETKEISSFANKGVHTTTYAEMFILGNGIFLIDTPGIKELGIMDVEEAELGMFFPEIKKYQENCKYYNCTHLHKPGCAVIEAVEQSKIAIPRYKSYISMMENEDNRR